MKESAKKKQTFQNQPSHFERFGFMVQKAVHKKDRMPSAHAHKHYEILYIMRGSKTLTVNNSLNYTLNRNNICLFKPYFIHQTCSDSDEQTRILVHIDTDLINEFCDFLSYDLIACFNCCVLNLPPHAQKQLECQLMYLTELNPDSPNYVLNCKIGLLNLLNLLTNIEKSHDTNGSSLATKSEKERIYEIMEHIGNNYYKEISVSDLADIACFSKVHLNRIFKKITGTTLHKYLVTIRLTKAREFLINSNDSVSSVAYSCGFNSPEAFSRAFKDNFGCSPTEFLRNKKIKDK